jgi:hypothetical protein
MANAAIIWTFAGVLAAACFARAIKVKDELAAEFLWYAVGTAFLLGGAFLWISLEVGVRAQHRIIVGAVGAILGCLASLAITERIFPNRPSVPSPPAAPLASEAPTIAPSSSVRNAFSDTQKIKVLPPSLGGNETLRLDNIATMTLVENSLTAITLALDSTPISLQLPLPPDAPIAIQAPTLTVLGKRFIFDVANNKRQQVEVQGRSFSVTLLEVKQLDVPGATNPIEYVFGISEK